MFIHWCMFLLLTFTFIVICVILKVSILILSAVGVLICHIVRLLIWRIVLIWCFVSWIIVLFCCIRLLIILINLIILAVLVILSRAILITLRISKGRLFWRINFSFLLLLIFRWIIYLVVCLTGIIFISDCIVISISCVNIVDVWLCLCVSILVSVILSRHLGICFGLGNVVG